MPQPEPGTIVHPAWCNPPDCTAQPHPTTDEYRAHGDTDFGEHRSQAVSLGGGMTIRLTMRIAPWGTDTFAQIEDTNTRKHSGANYYSAPYTQLENLLGPLVNLLGGIHADACPIKEDHDRHSFPAGDMFLWCNGTTLPQENPT